MDKKIVYGIGAVVAVVGLVAGATYLVMRTPAPAPASTPTPVKNVETTKPPTSESEQLSLRDLLARGGTGEYALSFEDENARTTGTVSMKNGKLKGKFTKLAKASGQTTGIEMVSDDTYLYLWLSQMLEGLRLSLAGLLAHSTGSAGSQNQNLFNFDQVMTITGGGGSGGGSGSSGGTDFTPPGDVDFTPPEITPGEWGARKLPIPPPSGQ